MDLTLILNLLDKWPLWKSIRAAPARIDELEKRLEALEKKPAGKLCPFCSDGVLRLENQRPAIGPLAMVGAKIHDYRCTKCGRTYEENA